MGGSWAPERMTPGARLDSHLSFPRIRKSPSAPSATLRTGRSGWKPTPCVFSAALSPSSGSASLAPAGSGVGQRAESHLLPLQHPCDEIWRAKNPTILFIVGRIYLCALKKKKEKTIQPMCSGNADQRGKLQMWCRDAAENADFQASYVMRTVRLGSEAGALQESSMDASVCVRAWAWRGGDTAGLGGKAQGRESFLGWKRQVSDTVSTPLPTLCLTFVVKWWTYIWFSVLLYYWSHGGSMGSIPIKVRRLNSWYKIKLLFWELAQKLLHKCCQICIKTN